MCDAKVAYVRLDCVLALEDVLALEEKFGLMSRVMPGLVGSIFGPDCKYMVWYSSASVHTPKHYPRR